MFHVDLPPRSRGGVARQVDLLATALVRRGHDVQVWSTTAGPAGAPYTVHVLPELRGRGARLYGVALRFRRAQTGDLDVLHAHGDDWLIRGSTPRLRTFYGSALMEARSATSTKRRVGQTFAYATEWLAALRADATTSISTSTRTQLPLVHRVVPCAVDEAFFKVQRPVDRRGGRRVLFVAGSLAGRKRGHLVVEAVERLRRTHPDVRLTLVCPAPVELPFVDMRSGVSTSELAELYANSDVLCSASSYEGFGVPYAEALVAGTPVVTTDNPGARDVLENGRLGVICHAEDLSAELGRVLDDDMRRVHLSTEGQLAASKYHPDVIAASFEGLYRMLIDSTGRT